MNTNTKHHIDIIRTNDKGTASLCRDDQGREGWVQTRWIKDSQVSDRVWTQAVDEQAERAARRNADREFKDAYHTVKVAGETDKAIRCDLVLDLTNVEKEVAVSVWFPKSMLDGEGRVPGWMIAKRLDDAFLERARFAPIMVESFLAEAVAA